MKCCVILVREMVFFQEKGGYISCHEQQLMQKELEMPSGTCGPAKDSGSPRRCAGVHRELVLLCFLAGSFLELRQKQI